jgi:AcrR family transcriptional regulator
LRAGHENSRHHSPRGDAVPDKLVDAARRILRRDGFDAITVEAVAAEAGAYRDAVRYHFGNKAGLIAAMIDYYSREDFSKRRSIVYTRREDYVQALAAGDREIAKTDKIGRDFFTLLPHLLLDDDLHERAATINRIFVKMDADHIEQHLSGMPRDELECLVRLMMAVVDGMSIQRLLEGTKVNLDRTFELWGRMLLTTFREAGVPELTSKGTEPRESAEV